MSDVRFVVGIDLGTTHCVIAASPVQRAATQLFDVPQLVAPGEVAARPLLPSFLYLPAEGELAPHDLVLPWGPARPIVGELARRLGAKTPTRLVASAKSWICHGGVNRRAPILPWSAPDSEPHVSPFEASVHCLAHLRAAWDAAHPEAPLARQEVVVTVPASFDEGARDLTLEAAREAGLGSIRLIEEPQAAFYDFLGEHEQDLGARLGEAKLVLVVDIGGGTTDLTLLRVLPPDESSAGQPRLERIAVGGHLLLGGDNMDAALAHHALEKAKIDRKLDPSEWSALVQSARQVKERLLAADAADEAVISIQQRGARLIGGTRSVTLERDEARRVLLDGFLPMTGPAEVAQRAARAGLTTLGLPYATDPAIPRHVCAFLRKHVEAALEVGARVEDGLPRPDLLLLNGGVFNAPAAVERLSQVLAHWYGGAAVPLLEHTSLDTAVARGAARYALARRGLGAVIGGGTARAYYIGVEGPSGERRALCVGPRGMEEGTTVAVPNRIFQLVLDRQVAFPLYAYTGDRADPAGALIDVDDELEPLPPVETVMRAKGEAVKAGEAGGVPVTLSATLSESGALELYLVTVELPPRRWRLEFALAGEPSSGKPAAAEPEKTAEPSQALPARFADARRFVERAFAEGGPGDPEKAKGVRAELEEVLGPRGEWSAATCRASWEVCMARKASRRKSPIHELNWLRLVGWCLRPGFGAPGDGERVRQMWALHGEGLAHSAKANWAEWWIMWRRVAAGLDRAQQHALFADVRPWLEPGHATPAGPRAHGLVEMVQLLAGLERLGRAEKELAGQWFLQRADKVGTWWPLGRLGARVPFHGEARDVVSAEVAAAWLERILALDWARADGAAFAAASIARLSGDPARDLAPELRERVLARLRETGAPASWVDMVSRATALSERDAGRVFGDALPAGLRLT